jgi:hypothetical protein
MGKQLNMSSDILHKSYHLKQSTHILEGSHRFHHQLHNQFAGLTWLRELSGVHIMVAIRGIVPQMFSVDTSHSPWE